MNGSMRQQNAGGARREVSAQGLEQGSLEQCPATLGGTARLLADRELSQSAHTWGQGK